MTLSRYCKLPPQSWLALADWTTRGGISLNGQTRPNVKVEIVDNVSTPAKSAGTKPKAGLIDM